MATHSSILAWRIPGTEEPGRLQSTGSQKAGHNSATEHTHTHTCSFDLHVVFVLGVQQSDSVIHIHIAILFQSFFPFRS